jgi:hypothetical protein
MSEKQPNIVFFYWDNFAWAELGCYGGGVLRGAPTPRIDGLAGEGLQLLNFKVEAQCALGDLRPGRRLAPRPLGGTRGLGSALEGIGPLLPANTSMMLAWAHGDMQTITDLSSPGAQSLIVRFNPAARGALLEF